MKNTNKSIFRLAVGVLLLLLVITFTGCIFFAGSDTGIAVPNLTIKGAPSHITALSLKVTGPGMSPVESYYSTVPSSITIEVPAGVDRQFELFMYTQSATLKGVATSDLTAGETTEIVLTMDLYETKLVIPDRALFSGPPRLVQIDDMSGTGWQELLTIASIPIRAHDIAFDSMGRIYIADNDGTDRRIVRIDNIAGENPIYIQEASIDALVAVSVDRNNNLVYFSDGTDLAESNLDGSSATQLNIAANIQTIRGMDIDEDGMLYIAGVDAGGSPGVFRYNTITNSVDATYGPGNLVAPWDILIKQEHLYVANVNGPNGFKILKLDLDLNFQEGFGNNAAGPYDPIPGNFYNPYRFIAILNKKIYLIDETNLFTNGDERIISMDNIGPWDNWETFYAENIGETPFLFYGC